MGILHSLLFSEIYGHCFGTFYLNYFLHVLEKPVLIFYNCFIYYILPLYTQFVTISLN